MKVGDCVKVDHVCEDGSGGVYSWTGICTWTDGYKFEFFIDGGFDIWTAGDLDVVGAEVISETR